MTVQLMANEIRAALWKDHSSMSGHRLITELFHQSFAEMMAHDSNLSIFYQFENLDVDDDLTEQLHLLMDHVYQYILGPRLAMHQNDLDGYTHLVLFLWNAIQELVKYLRNLYLVTIHKHPDWDWRRIVGKTQDSIPGESILMAPTWRQPVHIKVANDMMFKSPNTGKWFLVGLGLGKIQEKKSIIEAGLAYVLANRLTGEEFNPGGQSINAVFFQPNKKSAQYSNRDIEQAYEPLMNHIGKTAKVQ